MTDSNKLSIQKIDENISDAQDLLSSLPTSSHERPSLFSFLALLHLARFLWKDDDRDLETSILHSTHALFLPSRLTTEDNRNIISTLFSLSESLYYRSLKHQQPGDVMCIIKYFHYLRDPSLECFGINRNEVTASLVRALAIRIKLEPGNGTQDVEEMLVLCRELLSSDLPKQDLKDPLECFADSVLTGLVVPWKQTSQQVIECLHDAAMLLPDLHWISFVLFLSFVSRYHMTHSSDDYENAIAILNRILAPQSSTDSPNPYVGQALHASAKLLESRFNLNQNPEYLEEAISRHRAHLGFTSPEDPEGSVIIQDLVKLERRRLEGLSVTNDLPHVLSCNPEAIDLTSFSHLTASLAELNAVNSHSMTMEDHLRHLSAVLAMVRITDTANLQRNVVEEAAKYCRLLLTTLQPRSDDVMTVTYLTLGLSGNFFMHAFKLTHDPEYLNESIDVYQGILKAPRSQWLHFRVIRRLIWALWSRFEISYNVTDLDEMMRLFPIAINNTYGQEPGRFEISCHWALFSRVFEQSSTSTAYMSAISLMQDSLAFSPTLEMQHLRLVAMRDNVEKLPLDYASYQIHVGQLKDAIEILEQGRGLLWSELRGMRTSIDQLRIADLHLAEKFASVNQDLEALTTSAPPILWSNNEEVNSGEEMDPFGLTVVKRRKLLEERTSLITQIRSLPGFGTFLTSPSFDNLRSVAAHGPVIIISHCEWRSDIIILLHDSPPSHIPTPDNFYDRARSLKDQLSAARKKGLDSREYEDALTSVLEVLHDLVGRPVIQRLQELNVPEQSRIWWCPTSVFCSLPLHAMGPVRYEGALKLYFSDLYIPSYTPTLSALIESRKPGPHSFEKPSILLVAQPDEFMPAAWGEISVIRRLETNVTTLWSKKATPSAVMKHLRDHRFAHFSCHGNLETGKPFEASFKLYQGQRLTLLEIIRSQLPSAEFAFLSACHTAELTEESIADEGLHLSAAVQYSGFRSVAGTMWAMADIDGQVLAKHFYASLFSERWQGGNVPYYERTAEALRDAVKELRRRKKVTLERWVNFVHYGA